MPIKLPRIEEAVPASVTRLFDHGAYIAALKDYLDDRGPKPDPYCVMVLGQQRPFCRDDSTLLVSVTVTTSGAIDDLKKAEAAVSNQARITVGVGHRHCTTVKARPSVSHLSPNYTENST